MEEQESYWTRQGDTSRYLDAEMLEKFREEMNKPRLPTVHAVSPRLFQWYIDMGYINPDGSWRISGLPTGTGRIEETGRSGIKKET